MNGLTTPSALTPNVGSPKPESPTESEIRTLDLSVNMLQELLHQLEARLLPVLRPISKETGGDSKQQELSALASAIRGNRYRIEGANNTIKEILKALEL